MRTSREAADRSVENYLNEQSNLAGIQFVVTRVEEVDVGFVYYYDSALYLESGNELDMLAGNAPILVDKDRGTLVPLGTARDVSYYLDAYRQGRLQ
jgi:hypothetical protein